MLDGGRAVDVPADMLEINTDQHAGDGGLREPRRQGPAKREKVKTRGVPGLPAQRKGPRRRPRRVDIPAPNPSEANRTCFALKGVLSPAECEALIAGTEMRGYSAALINTYGGQVMDTTVRKSGRVIVDDEGTAKDWFDRIAPHLPKSIGRSGRVAEMGARNLVGLNERLRFLRYYPGEYFAPHQDGSYRRPDGSEASLLTLMVYLNTSDKAAAVPATAITVPPPVPPPSASDVEAAQTELAAAAAAKADTPMLSVPMAECVQLGTAVHRAQAKVDGFLTELAEYPTHLAAWETVEAGGGVGGGSDTSSAGPAGDFDGGETNFLDWRDEGRKVGFAPEAGDVLVFDHALLHEGAAVTRGVKYCARTDVMYTVPASRQSEVRRQAAGADGGARERHLN
jgi:hypothetical protein